MAYLREPCLPLPDSYVPSFSSQGDNLTLPNCEWLRHPWVSSVETDATCKLVSQFSHSVMSNSLWPGGLQHARIPCHHQLPEFTQTNVHRVSDAIQPSHPLLSPFPPAFNLPQHQSLFKWVSSSYQEAKVLEFQLQHQSFQWIFRTDFL